MAAPFAALIVRVLSDTAELVTGMKTVTASVQGVEKAVVATDSKLGGMYSLMKTGAQIMSASFAVDKIVEWTRAIVNAADEIDKLADRIGDTAENVQQLQAISIVYDVELQSLTNAAQNLQAALGDGSLNAAFAKLNLSVAELKTLSPTALYLAVAEALGRVTDATERAAIAKEVFKGKFRELATTFKENIADTHAFGAASNEAVEAVDALGTSTDRLTNLLKAQGIEWLANVSGMKAFVLAKQEIDALTGQPTLTGAPLAQAGFSKQAGGEALPENYDEISRVLGEQAKIQMEINEMLDEQAHHWLDLPIVLDSSLKAWERFRDVSWIIDEQVKSVAETFETRAIAAIERMNAALNKSVMLNAQLGQEAARTAASIETTIANRDAAATTDPRKAILDRADADIAKLDPTVANFHQAQWEIANRANAEIAEMVMGVNEVATATERATQSAIGLGAGFMQSAAAVAAMGDKAKTAYGYIDPQGNPTSELRSAVLATTGAPSLQVGAHPAASTVTNVTLNGVIATERESLRKMISDLIMEQATQGRKFGAAR